MLEKLGKTLALNRRKSKLKTHDFTILTNTCIGGVVTHSLGEQFRSPTVNVLMSQYEFMAFCKNLKEYAKRPVEELTSEEWEKYRDLTHPVGVIRGVKLPDNKGRLPDITLLFVHYKSFTEAKEKWEKRFKRVNYDNLYILMDGAMDATEEILDEFHALPFEHKVFFTDKEDPERWPCNFRFSFYTEDKFTNGCVYNTVKKGMAEYKWMDEFDFVTWLNDGSVQKNPVFE